MSEGIEMMSVAEWDEHVAPACKAAICALEQDVAAAQVEASGLPIRVHLNNHKNKYFAHHERALHEVRSKLHAKGWKTDTKRTPPDPRDARDGGLYVLELKK